MSSSGLKMINFQNMTNDNKQQKLSDGTKPAIAYSTCCVSGAVSKNGISLIHGDSLQALKSYGDNHFKIAIVDPPYGINAGKMTMGRGKHKFSKDKDWDSAILSEEYFAELFRVSENQIVWGGNYFTEFLPPSPHWLLWDKKNPNLSFAEGELAWVRKGKNLRIFQHHSAQVEEGGKIHPTQKPVKLYRWILNNYTSEGDLILDTHLGSGSIAIACHQMKRKLIGYEIDAEYYQKACKRFEEQTRQIALW